MLYKVLADITVLAHFLWVAFIVLGVLWGRKNRAVRIVHLSGLGFALTLQLLGWYCPLTHLEAWLRQRQAPGPGYPGSFIVHYLEEVIYLQVSIRALLVPTLALLAVTLWVYFGSGLGRTHRRT